MTSYFESDPDLDILFERARKLRSQGLDPFPAQFSRSCALYEIHEEYAAVGYEAEEEPVALRVCGRVVRIFDYSDQVLVIIEDQDTRLQVVLSAEQVGRDALVLFQTTVYQGDYLGFEVNALYRHSDELTAQAVCWSFLALSLLPIPASVHVNRQRQARYRHLVGSLDARTTLINRSRMMQQLRRFLEAGGFLEAAVPVGRGQQPQNYLQQLLTGAIERVYTTGINPTASATDWYTHPDAQHLYISGLLLDMETAMELTESMIAGAAHYLHSTQIIPWQPFEQMALLSYLREQGRVDTEDLVLEFLELDFNPNWPRRTMLQLLDEVCLLDFSTIEDVEVAADIAQEAGVPMDAAWTTVEDVCQAVFDQLVAPHIIQPTFVVAAGDSDPESALTRQFRLYINGMLFAEGLTGCNNPLLSPDAAQRETLLYGVPPFGCLTLQLDRLGMLMTGATDIRDVIVFPE